MLCECMCVLCVPMQAAREDIAIIKVVAPLMAQRVVDRAIQVRVQLVLTMLEMKCGICSCRHMEPWDCLVIVH